MKTVDFSKYDNSFYQPGLAVKRGLWYLVSLVFFQSYIFPFSGLKCSLLRLFGADIAPGVVIKPNVLIKYPWFLKIGENSWIGEGAWIDNLAEVSIGANVSISQGAMLLTGNHNYKKEAFDLEVYPIVIEDGVWIGAKAVVCPGVVCLSHAVLGVGSIATKNLESFTIYSGNPALPIRKRTIE